ncbi:MAG: hypothetical protein QOD56_1284, partial [Gammaproteobacteria bacterium]|nr:hypothetical protein [Gammaproteobacteria bacterium]
MERLFEGPHGHVDFLPVRFVATLQGILLTNADRDESTANFCFYPTFEFFNRIGPERQFTAVQRRVRYEGSSGLEI